MKKLIFLLAIVCKSLTPFANSVKANDSTTATAILLHKRYKVIMLILPF